VRWNSTNSYTLLYLFYLFLTAVVEGKEALAIYDFQARTSRELSFRKGDVLFLFEKVSVDWWEGATASSQKGLIPDKYIIVRHRCAIYFEIRAI